MYMTGDAAELKQELGNMAKDVIADGLGLKEDRGKKVLCPLHADKNPSMSWFEDGLMWRCHACQGTIDIYSYFTDFKHLSFTEAVEEVRKLLGKLPDKPIIKKAAFKLPIIPANELKELTEPLLAYMAKRKITKDTLDFWRVKQRLWGAYGEQKTERYVFQYFDEKDKLVFVTYREAKKGGNKGGCEKDTKPILWGMWHIDTTKPLVICEGQPDAMAIWQSGYKNVVSVPNGSNNLTWIEHCWEWLQKISEIIVFADNDAPGIEMAEKLKLRLKNVKILTSDLGKDANEILYRSSNPNVLLELITNKINEMPTGLLDLSDVEYKSAMNVISDSIETGFLEYDRFVEEWKPEELTVIFGRNGEGKSTFISQIIGHCLEKNVRTFLYSGEMSDSKLQDWLYKQMAGGKKEYLRTIKTKYGDKTEIKPEIVKKIKEWHKGLLYLYNRNEREITGNLVKFFEIMQVAARKFGVRLFVIDNLMSILEENADSLFSDQANFVQACKNFAIANKVHVVLLAHPNKEKREITSGDKGNLEKGDISGSNNIPNKADNIIAVERLWGENADCDAIITSLKDRNTGQRLRMKFFFSKNTLRFYNGSTPENKTYGWERKSDDLPDWTETNKEIQESIGVAPWDD